MMRYRLRTLLIVLALGPPMLAWWGWPIIDRIIHPPQIRLESVFGPVESSIVLPARGPRVVAEPNLDSDSAP